MMHVYDKTNNKMIDAKEIVWLLNSANFYHIDYDNKIITHEKTKPFNLEAPQSMADVEQQYSFSELEDQRNQFNFKGGSNHIN